MNDPISNLGNAVKLGVVAVVVGLVFVFPFLERSGSGVAGLVDLVTGNVLILVGLGVFVVVVVLYGSLSGGSGPGF